VSGNEWQNRINYDRSFEVSMPGGDTNAFDTFECAILAPTCKYFERGSFI
jgi:hypothetical protein